MNTISQSKHKKIDRFYVVLVLFVLVWFILFKWVFLLCCVPSSSMENTLKIGDYFIGTRIAIFDAPIERYQIVTFYPLDDPDVLYVKRVIGLPNETVEIRDGEIYVDGVLIDNSFIKEPMNAEIDMCFVVPDGEYFMLGDNRNHSNDSRYWNHHTVPLAQITSKALLRLSLQHGGEIIKAVSF